MVAKPMELFNAYEHNKLPVEGGGYILSVFYDRQGSLYTRYEIVAYDNLKDLAVIGDGLWFKSDGYKMHVLLEPISYSQRFQEPAHREKEKSIPYKFSDLEIFTANGKNDRVMVCKNPQFNFSSFTIQKPTNDDYTIYFRQTDSIYEDITEFLTKTIQNDIGATSTVAKRIAKYIGNILKNLVFKGYE